MDRPPSFAGYGEALGPHTGRIRPAANRGYNIYEIALPSRSIDERQANTQ